MFHMKLGGAFSASRPSWRVISGIGLIWLSSLAAAQAGAPTLRLLNYIALEPGRDFSGDITAACKSRGAQYQDALRCRIIEADGAIKGEGRAAPGQALRLGLVRGPARRSALEVNSGWNAANVDLPSGMPWACVAKVDQPMRTIGEWGPLYFFVPPGVSGVAIWVCADVTREAAHVIVRDPDGGIVLDREDDFDARTKSEIVIPAAQAAKPWSISLVRCDRRGWHTDDVAIELGDRVPGLLAGRPEWAAQFARDWRPPITAARSPRQPIAKPPTRQPYKPVAGDALAKAFERRSGPQWRTSLPFTYVLDYGSDHVGNESYISSVTTAPPTLLHLGKDVPLNHAWGPIAAYGGENQAHGSGDAIRRLDPAEVATRTESLRQMVDRLHAAGVRYVTPYICGMTLNGDPEKRTGFWEFYDHWDAYRPLGLGPRPAEDPLKWLQTTADGKPYFYYKYDSTTGFYPPFKTNHRFAACWRTAGWRDWLLDVVRFVAKTGCDGVFVDNGCSQRSRSTAALDAFRDRLKKKYGADEAKELLGIADLDEASFPDERKPGLATWELRRFWCETMRDQMAAMKDAGSRALGREFIVFPNGGHPAELQMGLRDADFVMFEKSIGTHGTNPGLVLQPVLDGVAIRSINDSLFEYIFVRSLNARVRPIILTRAGYPATIPHLVMNADAARLGMAECAAFSGGGGFLLSPRFDVYHDALNDYREFIESHPELYAGLLPCADAIILALPEQAWLAGGSHFAAVQRMTPELADTHLLFSFTSESRLDAAPWAGTKVVGAYDVSVLSDRHVNALAEFVAVGGTLLLGGSFAEKDELLRSRATLPPPLDAVTGRSEGSDIAAGKGRVIRVADEEAFVSSLASHGLNVQRADGKSTAGLRMAAYRSPDSKRLVLHIVNYCVPLGVHPQPVEDVCGLSVELPLPLGRRIAGFRLSSPDQTVRGGVIGGRVAKINIDHLRIYAVVELNLEDGP